jgi:hypothetical protein
MSYQLEERVAILEAEVERLKHKIEHQSLSDPWWKKLAGTFANNPAYDEAMRLGYEYRASLHSHDEA